jgi:glycosyltransferase involved in cell wall biosynthesis
MEHIINKKVCFFVKVENYEYLERVGFYRQDLQILKDLNFKVETAIRIRNISLNADIYYVWWWTWAFIPVLIGLIRRKPVIITGVFDHYIDGKIQDYRKRNFLHRLLIFFSLKFCTLNLFVSNLENKEIRKYFGKIKSEVSHLAIDNILFKKFENEERQFGLLFSISWLSMENAKRKKIFEMIYAMKKIVSIFPESKLIIAGKKDSAYNELMKTVIKLELTNHIVFTDAISEDEKIKYLRRCNIYLQPTEVEGFGLAILEAMACGAPVISSYVGTVPEVMGNGGLYLNHNSIDEIANTTISLMSDKLLAHEISVKAVERARKFTYSLRVNEMRLIFTKILNN